MFFLIFSLIYLNLFTIQHHIDTKNSSYFRSALVLPQTIFYFALYSIYPMCYVGLQWIS